MRERRISARALIALPGVALLALAGCGDDDDPAPAAETTETMTDTAETMAETMEAGALTVSDAWSRQPAEAQTVSAVYGVVSNPTDSDVTIIGASTDVTDRVELHETLMEDGAMTMREKEGGFVVPAGGEFVFESGGPHIMLFDIDPATYPPMVEVTLELDGADPVTFMAEVRAIDGTDTGHDMSGDTSDMSGDMTGDMSGDDSMSEGATSLHDVDEQLAAGMLDADSQRPVVAEAIAELTADGDPEAGTPQAELLALLEELDAALESGDLATAADAAAAAHEASHALEAHG